MAEASSKPPHALSPLTPSQLNSQASNIKKRKFVDDASNDADSTSFTIQLLSKTNSTTTFTLVPIAAFDRCRFRLSQIDFSTVHASLPSGQPFRANVPVLDHHLAGSNSKLLLVRLAPNGALYAVERVGAGIYLACRLGSLVKEHTFTTDSSNEQDTGFLAEQPPTEGLTQSLLHLSAASNLPGKVQTAIPSPKRPKNRRGILARKAILPKAEIQKLPAEPLEGGVNASTSGQDNEPQKREKVVGDLSSTAQRAQDRTGPASQSMKDQMVVLDTDEKVELVPAASQSADVLLETVRDVLFKTLYTSKSALAHFTKSTLARTRAAFRASSQTSTAELARFYRSRILSSKKMESKYRDALPKIIENAILQESPEKTRTDVASNGRTKKPSRRKRLGKDGLHGGEEDFVRTWWFNRDQGKMVLSDRRSRQQEMQDFLKELRSRETQLQIILILEIFTLESIPEVNTGGDLSSAPVKPEAGDDEFESGLSKIPPKIEKKRDLKPDLDIHVDRLCIDQSVSIVDTMLNNEIKSTSGQSGMEVRDKLRDFCCNVILPFYFHKVPNLVKEISRKLGGPGLSPKRPPVPSRMPSSRLATSAKTVEARRRPIPQQTLERVLSEEQGGRQSSPPVLRRSATTPAGTIFRRGSIEPSQRPSSRGNLQKSRSFSNREVDLVATGKAEEAKRKRLAGLAKQKEELNAAIHALKKPNRGMVGKEIMAEVEKRSVGRDMSRRSLLSRSSSSQKLEVQITATPTKGTLPGGANGNRDSLYTNTAGNANDHGIFTAQDLAIPSSTLRPVKPLLPSQPADNLASTRSISIAIHETPSRGPAKKSNPLCLPTPTNVDPSPIRLSLPSNLSVIQATPSARRVGPADRGLGKIDHTPLRKTMMTMTKSQKAVLMTPLRKTDIDFERAFRDAPLVSEKVGRAMDRVMNGGGGGGGVDGAEDSVYKALGWDDEDVDELL